MMPAAVHDGDRSMCDYPSMYLHAMSSAGNTGHDPLTRELVARMTKPSQGFEQPRTLYLCSAKHTKSVLIAPEAGMWRSKPALKINGSSAIGFMVIARCFAMYIGSPSACSLVEQIGRHYLPKKSPTSVRSVIAPRRNGPRRTRHCRSSQREKGVSSSEMQPLYERGR